MAYNAQNGGVYILINGDASPLQRTLENLKKSVSSTAKQIEAEMQGVFGRADISRVANTAISAFARLRTSIRAAGTDIQGHTREWAAYGRQIGLANSEAQRLAQTINRSLHEKNIRQIESSLRTLQRQTGMATSEVIRLAREMGAVEVAGRKAFAELGIRSGEQIRKEIANIRSAFDELKRSGTASSQDIARAQEAMRTRIAELNREMRSTGGIFSSLRTGAAGFVTRITPVTAIVATLTAGFTSLEKAALESYMAMERLQAAYSTIFGGKEGATAQLEIIREQVKAVGQEFIATAESAKSFFAAGKNSTLAPDINNIFKAISNTGAALQLTQDDINGVFRAFGQMISKGKVQAEELRGQVGERLPGAFQLAAKAMGMSTAALDKFMADGKLTAEDLLPKLAKLLNSDFSDAARNAANTLSGSIANMSSEWEQFKANIAASGPAKFFIQIVTEYLSAENRAFENTRRNEEAKEYLKKSGIGPDVKRSDFSVTGTETTYEEYSEETLKIARDTLETERYVQSQLKEVRDQALREESKRLDERKALQNKYAKESTSYKISQLKKEKEELIANHEEQNEFIRRSEKDAIKQSELLKSEADAHAQALEVINKKIGDLGKKAGGAGKSAHNAGVKAANAQGTYNTALETTQDHIEALQEQLKLDKTQTVAQKKIALENKYATAIAKTTEQIQKQIRSGSISAEQGKKLIALKQEENSLELQLKLREMEDKAIQENLSHLQEQLSFYNELAEMSGNFTTSMELQNKIIDIQAQKYRDLGKISEEMIQKWTEWKKLQASTDPFDGAYRGLLKFQAEFGNSAKQWEDLTYNFAKNFESASHQMFDDFLETGKLSFDSIGKLFKQLLKDMAYYALVQPIVLSTVGGFAGTSGSINGAVNGTSTGSNLANAVSGMAQGAVLSKAGGGLMGAAGNFLNSTAASLFPNTFAASEGLAAIGSEINGFTSAGLPTQTATGMLGSGWTMGAGLVGGAIGNYLLAPALGIKQNTGSQIGGMLGGAAGSIGGGLLGAAALGATVGGPVGAGIGALIGTVAGAFGGSLFGEEELEPGYYINAWTDLTNKKGLQGYKSGTATQNHSWDGFPSGTASRMRDEVARPIMDQLRTTTSEIKGQLKTVGGDALGKSFFDAVRKYQKSPSKNTGKYGEDLSQFFQIHGEWGDTTSPDIETWTKNLTKQYQEVIVKSIANMDMTPITKAADGFVANTEEEIAVALVKAGQLIAVGDTIDDEELKESFQTGISKSLISALKKIDTSKLGLKIDKSSLEGWVVAAQAMQKWQEVNTTLDAMIDPASEIESQFNTLNQQFVEWSATLKELGWNSSKIREVDKKRITYAKQYAEEVMSGFEPQDKYVARIKEINEAFNDVAAGLKTNGINADMLDVTERRDTVLRDYIDEIFAQFETTSEYNQNIKSIEEEFASAIAAMKEASDTFTDAEIQNAQKLRDSVIKEQQETIRASVKDSLKQFDVVSDAQSAFNEISKGIAEIIETMKTASDVFSTEEIEAVQKQGSEVLKRQAADMIAQYDSMSDIEQSITEIGTHFADVIDAMKAASDTFSAADIEAAQKKSAEVIRKQVSDLAKQYDNVSDAEQNLVGISEYFAELTAAMKSTVGIFGKSDFAAVQKKSTEAMRKYVASITDGYKKTTALKQSTDEINRVFNDLISAMKKVGMSVQEVTAVEQQRADALADLRAETLRGYNEDLDKRYNTLKNGSDTDTTSLLNLWYSQNNELEEIAKAIGRNNTQYKTTVQVQQAEYLQSQIEILQKQLKTLLQDQLTAATSALNNAVSLKNTFSSVVRTLKTALRNLWTSEENLTGTRYSEAYKQFNETYQKAIAGDTEALNELPEIGSTVLALAKEQVSTRGEYDTAFYDITKRIKKASDYAQKQLSIAEKEEAKQQSLVNSINAKIEAANGGTAKVVNSSVESLQSLIADYQKRLADILHDISNNTGIISDNIVVLRSLNDGTDKSRNAILAVKSELMKYGETIGDRQLTQAELAKYGNMTSEEVLASIEATGMSFDEWYQRYGVHEFDEAAKRAGIVVNSIDDLRKVTDAYDKLLAAKADVLNKQMITSGEVAAGGWTAQKVLEAINKSGLTVAQWYEQFGRAEGFTLNAAKTTNGIITNLGAFLEKSIGKLNDGSTTSKQAILDTKVQLMKYGEAVWKGQLSQAQRESAANMTSAQILKSIEDSGLTFDEWYNKYGSKELIEAAKNTGVVINSIEDLHKITDAYDRLLAQKADTLNSSMYTTAKVAAGGWTSDLVRQEILSRGMTVKEWYDKYGKSEGYLLNIFGTSKTLDTDVKNQTSTLNNSIAKGTVDYSNVLKQKADALNASMYSTASIAAGGWTADLVRQEILSRGMTVKEWYEKYGKSEGYLLNTQNNTGNTNVSVKDGLANLGNYLNSKFTSMSDMLSAKVASLNQSAYLGKTNWTVAEAVAKMEKEFGSVDNWFKSVGKNESFAQSSSTSSKSTSSSSTSSKTSSSTSASSSSNNTSSSTSSSSKTTTSTASKTTTSTAVKSTSSSSTTSNFAGSKYKTEADLLEAKVKKLNSDKYLGRSDWTAAKAKAEMVKYYGSVANWYTKKGKSEGFATGGITPRNMPFWVGERGPELLMSPQSYGVLNNKDSMDLMRCLYTSSSKSDTDYLYFAINETNNVLRQTLRKVDQMEYDLHRNRLYLQKWDTDGLPATAV